MAVKKILFIIEKNQELLSMLDMVLKKEYSIYSFIKADDSFYNLLENLKPDLLILEWLSYFANSNEIIETVRSRYKASCKILIISTRLEVKNKIPENTIDGFLMKPFNLHELKDSVYNAINSQQENYRHQ